MDVVKKCLLGLLVFHICILILYNLFYTQGGGNKYSYSINEQKNIVTSYVEPFLKQNFQLFAPNLGVHNFDLEVRFQENGEWYHVSKETLEESRKNLLYLNRPHKEFITDLSHMFGVHYEKDPELFYENIKSYKETTMLQRYISFYYYHKKEITNASEFETKITLKGKDHSITKQIILPPIPLIKEGIKNDE